MLDARSTPQYSSNTQCVTYVPTLMHTSQHSTHACYSFVVPVLFNTSILNACLSMMCFVFRSREPMSHDVSVLLTQQRADDCPGADDVIPLIKSCLEIQASVNSIAYLCGKQSSLKHLWV